MHNGKKSREVIMKTLISISFVGLITSAPWVSRKWGAIGEWTWGIIVMVFLILVILLME